MKLHFLGTAAAEGFPGLFCRCEMCLQARKLGGPNIRTRASVLYNDVLKVDFPPDTLHHVLRDGLDLASVTDLLVTHTHHDHFAVQDLAMRRGPYAHELSHPLRVYGNDAVIAACEAKIGQENENYVFQVLEPFTTVDIGPARVTPLLADHNPKETCFIYHLECQGQTVLHGHDSGWFPEATWDWLGRQRLDFVVFECTSGVRPGYRNHLNIEGVLAIHKRFLDEGVLADPTHAAVTHFSHNCGLLHHELVKVFQPEGITTAYDGLVLEIGQGGRD